MTLGRCPVTNFCSRSTPPHEYTPPTRSISGSRNDPGITLEGPGAGPETEFFIDNPLVQIHFISEMIRWTGLAPWKFESPFPGARVHVSRKRPKKAVLSHRMYHLFVFESQLPHKTSNLIFQLVIENNKFTILRGT
jgi:hypothetical protein